MHARCSRGDAEKKVDDNFFNGFGGPGSTFAFSQGSSFGALQPTANFLEWHHYMMTFDQATAQVSQYIDGVRLGGFSVASLASSVLLQFH